MEIRSNFHSTVSNRIGNVLEIVYCIFLGDHINDLVSCRNISFVLVSDQLVNFLLRNFIFGIMPDYIPSCLETFNVMPRNTHVNLVYFKIWIGSIAGFQCLGNCFDGFIDVQHLSVLYTI